MKQFRKRFTLLAVVAVAFAAVVRDLVVENAVAARRATARGLHRLESFVWMLEVKRLVAVARRRGWDVRFHVHLPGDPLGFIAGLAEHATKTIHLQTYGLSQRRVAELLAHELDHAAGAEHAATPDWLRCGGTWGPVGRLVSLAFTTVAGSTLGVSTAAPGTYDLAGYSASPMVYTLVGEITDLGGGYGRQYNTTEHAPVASAQRTQKKASYALGTRDIVLAWDDDDAGQTILRTASANNSILTFELVKQDGSTLYFTAQVSQFVENMGTVDNVNQGMVTLLPQTDIVRVAAP